MAEPSSSNPQAMKTLMGLFERQKPDGTFVYSDAEVRHYLPYLVLSAKVPLDRLHDSVQLMVGQLVVDAKLDLKAGAEKVQVQLEAYYAAHPVNPELHKAVLGFARESLAAGASGDAGRAAVAAMLGQDKASGVLGGGLRPAGTTPGGPLARLAAMAPPKKK